MKDFASDVMYDFEQWLRNYIAVYRMQESELVVLVDKEGNPVPAQDALKAFEASEPNFTWVKWKNAADAYLDTLK